MFPSKVFEMGDRLYVVIHTKNIPLVPPKKQPTLYLHNFRRSPKYHDDMYYYEIHNLMLNSVPVDRWVKTDYVKKDTGVPYTRCKIAAKLKNMKELKKRRLNTGHVEFIRMSKRGKLKINGEEK